MTNDNSELAEIRTDLREMRWYVDDAELRDRASEWIEESHETSDANTAEEYVESKLNELLAEYEMYHAPGLARGSDGFPDRCSDCRHYGSACPVLTDRTEIKWRERLLEDAKTEQDSRRVYQQQAIDVSCKVIPQMLERWDNEHSEFIKRGQQLVEEIEELLHGGDGDDLEAPTDVDVAVTDGGGE